MRYRRKSDPICLWYGCRDLPDPEYFCAICGGGLRWWEEPYGWDEHGQICHAGCLEEDKTEDEMENDEMDREIQTPAVSGALIVVRQLPVIEERLHSLKEKWERSALDAEAMVCTEETIQAVKAARAKLNQEFDLLEEQRKEVKRAIMDPYDRFETVYKECVTDARNRAVSAYSAKISEVEQEQKLRCEEALRDYFAELCAVRHLDWLTYERAGIKVDMASAKAKTPAKLRRQLAEFVTGIADSADRINAMDGAEEIMVEFRRSLDAEDAIYAVQERHRRIEEERHAKEAREAVLEREAEAVRQVEALAPPVQVEQPKIVKCTFTVRTTMDKLKKLKQFLEMEGIQYE